jgi:hypothetical protein
MNRILWAALIAGLVLLGFVRAVQTFGAPPVIIALVILFAVGIKVQNHRASGHRASGIDELNQPGRAVTVDDRTSRWWDAEAGPENTGKIGRVLLRLLPYYEIRIGSLDKARRQQAAQKAGRPVRPIDWTAPNRNGGASFAGGMTASGMTYDWCTCSEQAMPLIVQPDGSTRANNGAETCLCLCCECAPKGSYLDADGKRQPVRPRHWRAREMEHEVLTNIAAGHDYERRFTVRWGRRYDAAVALIEDIRADRRDRQLAADIGYEHPNVRRERGEEVITDTDEWYYRREQAAGPDEEAEIDTEPIDPRPGGHE